MPKNNDVLLGLGAIELAAGSPRLRSLDPSLAPRLAAMALPADGPGYELRLALAALLGADPAEGLRRFAARGGAALAAELDRLADLAPRAGGMLRLRAAGAAALLSDGVRPAGAAGEADASPAALARWAALPFDRARAAYLAVLRAYPDLAAPLAGRWDPDEILVSAAAWPPRARARLAAGV